MRSIIEELTDKQRETLEKFDDCYSELTGINERDNFIYTFRLGMASAFVLLKKHFFII